MHGQMQISTDLEVRSLTDKACKPIARLKAANRPQRGYGILNISIINNIIV